MDIRRHLLPVLAYMIKINNEKGIIDNRIICFNNLFFAK